MFKTTETIPFRAFMDGSYKEKTILSTRNLSAYSIAIPGLSYFLHMSPAMTATYIGIGVMGGVAITGVLLEQFLATQDKRLAAFVVNGVLSFTVIGTAVGTILYVLSQVIGMFL